MFQSAVTIELRNTYWFAVTSKHMNNIPLRSNFQAYHLCTGTRLFLTRYVSDRNLQSDKATGWTMRSSIPGKGKRFLLFLQTSRSALVPTQSPLQWVSGLIPRG